MIIIPKEQENSLNVRGIMCGRVNNAHRKMNSGIERNAVQENSVHLVDMSVITVWLVVTFRICITVL